MNQLYFLDEPHLFCLEWPIVLNIMVSMTRQFIKMIFYQMTVYKNEILSNQSQTMINQDLFNLSQNEELAEDFGYKSTSLLN